MKLFVLLGAYVLSAAIANAEGSQLTVVNSTGAPVSIWAWQPGIRNWATPLIVDNSKSAIVTSVDRTSVYVVAIDLCGSQECRLGWINIKKLVERDPKATIVIRAMKSRQTTQQTETVWNRVFETRTRDVVVWHQQIVDGVMQYVPETRQEQYTVMNWVPEQRTRTLEYVTTKLGWLAWGSSGHLRSIVTFLTEEPGAVVKFKLAADIEGAVTTSERPTTTSENLNIGDYIFWAQRGDNKTSTPTIKEFYDEKYTIKIVEAKN